MGVASILRSCAVVGVLGILPLACGGAESSGLFGGGPGGSGDGGVAGSDGGAAGSDGGSSGEGGGSGDGGSGGGDCVGPDCPPASCGGHSECEPNEYCDGDACAPDICIPGTSECAGNVLATCNEVGNGRFEEPCDGERTCQQNAGGAACEPWACWPGPAYCEGETRIECSADGLSVVSAHDCAQDDMLCDGGECYPPEPENPCPPAQPSPNSPCVGSGFGRACNYGSVTCTCWAVWTCG